MCLPLPGGLFHLEISAEKDHADAAQSTPPHQNRENNANDASKGRIPIERRTTGGCSVTVTGGAMEVRVMHGTCRQGVGGTNRAGTDASAGVAVCHGRTWVEINNLIYHV